MKASILSLQNNSSSVIASTIQRISKGVTLSNHTFVSEMSSFSYASNITTVSNSRNVSNGSLILVLMAIIKIYLLPTIPVLLFL